MKSWAARVRAAVEHLEPEQAALVLSVGLVLGVFPIMGFPTALCLLAALGLRLNFAALQLLNNLSSPLQLILLLPLTRTGAWLCRDTFAGDGSAAARLAAAAAHAVAGWACLCVPLGALLYAGLVFFIRKRRPPWSNTVESPA